MAESTYSVKMEQKAFDFITYAHDGPVTPFVIMGRAVDAAAEHRFPVEEIANAMHSALANFGELAFLRGEE